MSGITRTPRRTVRHRRRSNVTASTLTPRPLTHDAITFRDVEDTESKQVVGKEVVYTPLEADPNLPHFSDFNVYRHDNSTQAYCAMTAHAIYLLRCRSNTDLHLYFNEGGRLCRFDQKVLNLSVDALRDGRIQYLPIGGTAYVELPAHAATQIRILYCFIQYLKYLYDLSDGQIDMRMFRKVQYDDFRTNLYTPEQPIFEEIGWLANRNDMVEEYLAKKEEDSRWRTPAAEFQRQIMEGNDDLNYQ